MSTLNVKDASRLETIRKYSPTDKAHHAIMNRPTFDMEQRDLDIERHVLPARGFRVRQEDTPSDSVEVEAGVFLNSSNTVVSIAQQTFGTIPASSAGNIRIDVLWFDLATSTVTRTAGTEGTTGAGFGALTKPTIPSNDGAIPLAWLYVDETPTSFDRQVAIDNAGHIADARPAFGGSTRLFEDTAGNFSQDATGGAVGSSNKVARADHAHPLNVDAAVPPDVTAGAGQVGTATAYARRDHSHRATTPVAASAFFSDTPGGAVGVSGALPRADHRHPLNVDATLPGEVKTSAGAAGSGSTYARIDHEHVFNGMAVHVDRFIWSNEDTAKSTGALSFTPKFAVMVFAGHLNTLNLQCCLTAGFAIGTGTNPASPEQGGVGIIDDSAQTANETSTAVTAEGVGVIPDKNGGFFDNKANFDTHLRCNFFSKANGVQVQPLEPQVAITGTMLVLVVGDP